MRPSEYFRDMYQESKTLFLNGSIDRAAMQHVVDVACPKGSVQYFYGPDKVRYEFVSNGYVPPADAPDMVVPDGMSAFDAVCSLLVGAGFALKNVKYTFFGVPYFRKTPTVSKSDPKLDELNRKKHEEHLKRKRNQRRNDKVKQVGKDVAKGVAPAGASVASILAMREYAPELFEMMNEMFQPMVDTIQSISDTVAANLDDILAALRQVVDFLKQLTQMYVQNLGPALMRLNQEIVEPYIRRYKDGMVAIDKLRKDLDASGQRSDATDPAIVGPNYTAQDLLQMSIAVNTPIVRDYALGIINAEQMMRYMAGTSRGFGNHLDAWRACASGLNPARPLQSAMSALESAARVPDWFLRP